MIKINSSLEALGFGSTLSVFSGDRTLAFRGPRNLDFFKRVKTFFQYPRSEEEIQSLDPEIYNQLSALLETGILVKDGVGGVVDYYGSGEIHDALRKLQTSSPDEKKILVCIPDKQGLWLQKKALASLKEDQYLLTGFYRGTSVFVAPLISDSTVNLIDLFHRLLSTEPGIGNAYLAEELMDDDSCVSCADKKIDRDIALWIASDLFCLIRQNVINDSEAYIYRGSFVLREDVSFKAPAVTIKIEDSLEDKANALAKMFVGTGRPVARVYEFDIGDTDNPVYAARAQWARPRVLCQQENEERDTWGTGDTRAAARVAAIMEGIERYSTGSYKVNDYPLCARANLNKPALDRLAVACYGKMDFYFEDLPPGMLRRWYPVKSLLTNKEHVLPLELVCFPVFEKELKYFPTDRITSCGVAAHFDRDLAIDAACHELIERDAFMIAWLRKASPPIFDLASMPERIVKEIRMLERAGWTVKIMDLTADLAPVINVLLTRKSEIHRLSLGASSRENAEQACLKALREAQLSFSLVDASPESDQERVRKQIETIRSPNDHIDLYSFGDYDHLLTKFFGAKPDKKFSEMRRFSGSIVDRIHKGGLEVLVADLVDRDIKRLADNIHVVRAIVPGLVPMHFGQDWHRTGSKRISSIPENFGWSVEAKEEADYQFFPHPFH